MADVRDITIVPQVAPGGEVIGYDIHAHVEVAGEVRHFDFTTEEPTFHALVDEFVNTIRKEALEMERPEMERDLDAGAGFSR